MLRRLLKLFLLLALLGAGFLTYSFHLYHAPRAFDDLKPVTIVPGTGVRGIIAQLQGEGMLPATPLLAAPMLLSGHHHSLKAGEYEFAMGSTPAEILGKIVRGEVVVHKITIPEGWTSYQVRAALMAEPLLSGELPASIPEGSVLPDTLHFQRGEARSAVLARMQQAHEKLVAQLWEKRAADLPVATPREAVILASIIERETGEVDERALVSGVFTNRLRIGMLLQSDPTVAYGIEMKQGGRSMERELSRTDLKTDTPYNTYTRTGLPPGPICNPGRKAIEAALNPAFTDALYFVATGSGGHHFAKTLPEHERNVAAYRRTLGR